MVVRCGGAVWWWCNDFLVIIIPTPVWVFDYDFDWGVAITSMEENLMEDDLNGKLVHTMYLGILLTFL